MTLFWGSAGALRPGAAFFVDGQHERRWIERRTYRMTMTTARAKPTTNAAEKENLDEQIEYDLDFGMEPE
jgi:hypothetical protein